MFHFDQSLLGHPLYLERSGKGVTCIIINTVRTSSISGTLQSVCTCQYNLLRPIGAFVTGVLNRFRLWMEGWKNLKACPSACS